MKIDEIPMDLVKSIYIAMDSIGILVVCDVDQDANYLATCQIQ
jgi:hypothetical protein